MGEGTGAGRIALVTGAGSGIGKAVSAALVGAGWTVVMTGRGAGRLQGAADEIDPAGARTRVHAADVGDPGAVAALFAAIEAQHGRLDLLFNNAGVFAPAVPLDELPAADWDAVVRTNLTGAFLCLQGAFRLMKKQSPRGGRIINNGSISAHAPRPNAIAYTATKHAMTGLTRSAALDGRPFDIACGQIDIGNAATDMTQGMAVGMPQADGRIAPEPRMAVGHVADAVLYMAGLPLDANVLFMTVMATAMPFVGRG
jgi:NAD(P)-dependent dehydrogenase (short-subunit alcohol dehydrogenase family)